jgi:hypothetical protein
MTSKQRLVWGLVLSAAGASATCERSKSSNPTSPSVAGPIPGVAITAPTPLEPQSGSQLVSTGQPQTLLIENAGTSGARELWLQFEIAGDTAFQRVVHHADRVAPGGGGRTSYRLPEPLGAGQTYYWRVRAMDGANTGPYSSVVHFSVVDPVVIEAPTPLDPVGNINTNRPQFRVRNGNVSGPAGDLVYRFEVATAPDTSAVVAVISAVPNGGGTTTMSMGDLPWNRTFYWRVWATDGSTQSPYSGVMSFKTPNPPPPPPPPPAPGPAPGPGTPTAPGPGGPSPVPAACGPGDPSNRYPCVAAVAASSSEWARCAAGSGVGCHRFARQVVFALSQSDPNWRMIVAARGGHACNCSGCGPSDGGMFREDTAVYGGNRVFDMIVGAGGPSPSLGWSEVPGPRAGDVPAAAPLCQ